MGTAQAELFDRGGGFIYDSELDITWTQNANLSGGSQTFNSLVAWAAALELHDSVRDVTWSDWRIAQTAPEFLTPIDCSTATETQCKTNEYGYMYFYNGVKTISLGPFTNLANLYFSAPERDSTSAWRFAFDTSTTPSPWAPGQNSTSRNWFGIKNAAYPGWAVREGDVGPNQPAIGGTVSGLIGSGLVLQTDDLDDLPIAANGSFKFAMGLDTGSNYNVSILTQPDGPPLQNCAVTNGNGVVGAVAVTSVTVACNLVTFTVTSSVDGADGDISPLGEQQVNSNETTEYMLAPDEGNLVEDVTGSCGGSLVGLTYTTDPITEDCTVVASFKLKPERVFENGFEDPPKIVFVTSNAYSGGSIGGLIGGDQICNDLAGVAGLAGSFAAWLSTTSPSAEVNAIDRVGDNKWVRTDGAPVADNLADLVDSTLQNPINKDEFGNDRNAVDVWTGTGANGLVAGGGDPCSGWAGSGSGLGGDSAATDGKWTANAGLLTCNNSSSLYCFGQ